MEPLHRRSDGVAETPSGLFAIVPRYASGRAGPNSWFEFKTDVFALPIRVEWPTESPFILIEQPTANAMMRLQYADSISDDLLDRYNLAREEWLAAQPAPEQAPAASKVPEAPTEPPPPVEPAPPPDVPEWTPPTEPPAPVATKPASGDNAPSGGKGRRG